MPAAIHLLNPLKIKSSDYQKQFVGCLVVTQDNKILLQQRGPDFAHYADYLCEFGGHIEAGETPIAAIIRELKEELGANAKEQNIIRLGALTEATSNHSELIYTFFWHDVDGSITGCYEGTPKYFDNAEVIVNYPKITDGLRWMLQECQLRKLIV